MKIIKNIINFKILPFKIFILNEKMIKYVDITKKCNKILLFGFLLTLILGYSLSFLHVKNIKEETEIINLSTKHDHAIGDIEWKDSIFNEYKLKADLYLSQPIFKGTPLNGEILSLAARNAYDSTGIILPLELALAQAQWESGMGRLGRSPKKNPYNIGEHDTGTVIYFKSTFDGVQAYYYIMCKEYLSCKSLNELFINYTNCYNYRYSSKLTYEDIIKYQYYYIQNWLKNNYIHIPKNIKNKNILKRFNYKYDSI